jgi:FdhD protein
MKINFSTIVDLINKSKQHSRLYKSTGGAHGCALSDTNDVFIFSEDIGRHNAIDKVIGKCILDDIPLHDKVLFTTGRISTAILMKPLRAGIPIIISRSAPTLEAIDIANLYGITMVGFARGRKMNIYSHEERIV